MFEAKANSSTIAYLQGTTIPISEAANLSSSTTVPMDLSLWHRRLCHPSYPVIKRMIKENLVTGLEITSPSTPDPICSAKCDHNVPSGQMVNIFKISFSDKS